MPEERPPNPRISRLTAKKRPAVRYAIVSLAAFCLLLSGFVSWEAWHARRQRLADTTAASTNIALALAAQGEGTLRAVDAVLAGVVERVEHDGLPNSDRKRLRRHLRNMAASVKEVHALFVYGADGSWVATSLDPQLERAASDREYFQYHRTHKDRRAHVGLPVRNRATGAWILPISRRLDNPDGSFAGVVLGAIRVDYFSELYGRFDIGDKGSIILLHDHGILVYRRPFNAQLVGSDVTRDPVVALYKRHGPAGSAIVDAPADDLEQLYSYRHFDGFPLIVAVVQSKREVLAPWRQSTLVLGGIILASIALLGGVGWRLVRQIIIRDRLEAELVAARATLQQDNRELTKLADLDAMTGIANRRRFEEVLHMERKRAARSGAPLSLIMLDVDFFKKFNDTYGHVAGDECLRKVACALRDSLARPTDLAARYGGEEFVALLPGVDRRGARRVAERIRAAVMAAGIPHARNPPGVVTVSGGTCTMRFGADDEADVTLLIERADALLYRAKQSGRNRICADEDDHGQS